MTPDPAPLPLGWSPERSAKGTFLPGNGGRPIGSKNKASRAALNAVQEMSSEAIDRLRDKMREGDMTAIRYILDYTLPRGGRTVELDSSDPNAIIDAAAHGIISPDEAARLAQSYKTAADAADLKEIKAQVDELELLISALKK